MIDTYVEAVRASTQPCTFLLLAPTLVTTVVVRATWTALASTLVAAIVGGWVLAGSSFVLHGVALQLSAAAAAVMWILATVPVFSGRLQWARRRSVRAAAAAGGTFVATLWWRPCVGIELGRLLTAAQDDPVPEFPGIAAYMIGAMTPVVIVTLAAHAVALPTRASTIITATAATVGCAIGAVVMLGQHDAVVVALTRWTQG